MDVEFRLSTRRKGRHRRLTMMVGADGQSKETWGFPRASSYLYKQGEFGAMSAEGVEFGY